MDNFRAYCISVITGYTDQGSDTCYNLVTSKLQTLIRSNLDAALKLPNALLAFFLLNSATFSTHAI